MPGRPSTRTSATSQLSKKSSSQTLSASRRSAASLPVEIPEEGPTSSLRNQICSLFGDAQRTTSAHRKLIIGLRKIQEACAYDPPSRGKKGEHKERFGEDDFNVEFTRCVVRLMGVKKSEGVGDKLVRFVGLFLRHASEKDVALIPEAELTDAQSFPETASTRLISYILSMLLQFLTSKEKTVRYRATQLVAIIINSLDSIDDEYYHLLKIGLLKRVRDKEPTIRVQAVMGLGRLAGNGDDGENDDQDSDDNEVSGLLDKLLDILQNDPSAEVRRSLLLNLPLTPGTLPYLLERARDLDAATRRALYSRLLPALGDFRHLSLSMREKLLRWGLRDRDENVRNSAARLFRERWIEDCASPQSLGENEQPLGASPPSVEGLLELLERIDIVNSGVEGGVAGEAMQGFWDGRPDYQEEVRLDDPFWDTLTPESIFMARTLNDFYRGDGKYEAVVEEKLPEVTKLAFFLQRYTNTLIEVLQRNAGINEGMEEEETVEQEFIVEQLLHIAKTLDYSDEVGRRKMFTFLRETLAIAELPDEITKLAIDVLRIVCGSEAAGEREFCGVVLEAVAEVHDAIAVDEPQPDNDDESFHSARSELSDSTPTKTKPSRNDAGDYSQDVDETKAIREIMINMKCLHIAQCMLQNVEGNLQSNIHLVTMLNNLVVPAVRSHEAPIRERGLLCLGLCCLLDKNLADENLSLFLHCFNKGHDTLQVTAIQTIADILQTHPSMLTAADADPNLQKSTLKVFGKGLKACHTPDVQSAATTALCKLMLTSVIQDEGLLKQAVVCFFDPSTKDNAGVRQALSYFLPVYCHSRKQNMERMANIAGSVMHSVVDLGEELDEDEEMVGISVVGNLLVDWTDARKLVVLDEAAISWDEAGRKQAKAVDGDVHLVLAQSLLKRTLNPACSKEDRKAVATMLGKLYITSNSSCENLQSVNELLKDAIDGKIATDAASRTALNRLRMAVEKALAEASKGSKDNADNTVRASVVDDGMTAVEGQEESIMPSEPDVKMEQLDEEGKTEAQDSILEELLDDDGDDL